MTQRPLRSEDEQLLEQLRSVYQQLEPSDALLGRVQARLGMPANAALGRPARALRRRLLPRISIAAVAVSAAAWALWSASPVRERSAAPPASAGMPSERVQMPAPAPRPTAPPVAASAPAAHPFFELPRVRRGGHTATGDKECLGSWDPAAIFPRLGFSAQEGLEALLGEHACTLRWEHPERETARPGAVHLFIRRGAGPLVSCDTDRGIRVPLEVEVDGLFEAAPLRGDATLLVSGTGRYALSFRNVGRHGSSTGQAPEERARDFSFFSSATGLLSDLRRHESWRASIVDREVPDGRRPLRRTGELSCQRVP
jgi:hypothetical protein